MYGGDNIATAVYTFILGLSHGDPVPHDWVDAVMLFLIKARVPSLTVVTAKE